VEKVGEILLSIGAVSAGVLNRALMLQRATGGRIGTILLEQGWVTEETLARALAKATGRSYAHWERVQNAPRDVLALFPARIAVRAYAVPFDCEGRVLRVAMRDPNDLAAEDELAFVTGKRIESWSIAEFRLAEALERFYGERRSARFRALSERLERRIESAGAPPPPLPPPPDLRGEPQTESAPTTESGSSDVWRGVVPGAAEDIEIATWRPMPSAKPAASTPAVALEFAAESEHVDVDVPSGSRLAPAERAPVSLEEARERIHSAETRDDIADAALAYLAPAYSLVALFIARKSDVIGWQARGEGVSKSGFKTIRIPFKDPSVFLNVKLSNAPYQGTLPDLPAHAALVEALGHPPGCCAIFPVVLKKRVVAFLFLELQTPVLSADRSEEMKALSAAIADGLAVRILQQRSKAKHA
jgi:hypothetical protein